MPLDPTELFPELANLFEFPSVHSDMIYDTKRVNVYRRAIEHTIKPGNVIADVGTGTGLLSFLCLQAGAARVHAIDRSSIIKCAEALAEANGFSDRIKFYHSDSRCTEIDEKVDVIVSELIGHLAFEEGMVESLSDAKRRFLKPNGSIIPQTVTLLSAPVFEREVYNSCINRWKPAYGLDYSFMRERALRTSYVTDISEKDLLAECQPVFSVDFVRNVFPTFLAENTYTTYRPGKINGMAFWFHATLAHDVNLSSSPWSKTHWKQCFTPISTPVSVHAGDKLRVFVEMKFASHNGDALVLNVEVSKEENDAP